VSLTRTFKKFFNHSGFTGITAGAHRLWGHKTYKANLPLQLILMIFNSMSFEGCIIHWCRDHRVHHKYSETDADPYNSTRGFFFSHVGWLLVKKHPNVLEASKRIDMSDLYADPVLRFQRNHYFVVMPMMCFVFPTVVPYVFWDESLLYSWLVPTCLRYIISLNAIWSVNSFAHLFGNKPYDKQIAPGQNLLVSAVATGEGWHNYHHVCT
jgi:stearoyl-CoA desaturase (Delta-9 desaturase)